MGFADKGKNCDLVKAEHHWYKIDGTIDQDKTRIDQKNYTDDPNVKGTPTRPT